jgi:hypothetical protein
VARSILLVLAVVLRARSAAAEAPGQTAPQVPPASSYQPATPIVLTDEEKELLDKGEIDVNRHWGGTFLAVFVGFGSGQAVQGRFGNSGAIYAVGEVVSAALAIEGASRVASTLFCTSCSDNGGTSMMVGGLVLFSILHVAEVVDAIAAPPIHNARVRKLRARIDGRTTLGHVAPYLAPAHGRDGTVAGIALRF